MLSLVMCFTIVGCSSNEEVEENTNYEETIDEVVDSTLSEDENIDEEEYSDELYYYNEDEYSD